MKCTITEKEILDLPLSHKVGQVCSPIFQSSSVTPDISRFITEYGIAFVRYCPNAFYDNHSKVVGSPNSYLTPASNASLLNSLQTLSMTKGSGVPLIFGVDQEGGTRNDINRYGALVFGSHMSFGCANDPKLTEEAAYLTGCQMRSLGINLVQAPITDVFSFAGRHTLKAASFGEDPKLVTEHALAMMRGYQRSGLAVMIKHFPGYGATAVDAHKGMAEVTKSFQELELHDNLPIRSLLQSGAEAVMTGHVIVEAMDSSRLPATLSAQIIRGYLRKTLGFQGVVETDAMRMSAIQEKYGTAQASIMALQAGCDVLLLRGDSEHFLDGYRAVYDAVKTGVLDESLLNESLLRIHRLRKKINIYDNALVPNEIAARSFRTKEVSACEQAVAAQSVVVLRDREKQLPLVSSPNTKILVIQPKPQKLDGANDSEQSEDMLIQEVVEQFPGAQSLLTELVPTVDNITSAKELCAESEVVIVGSINAINFDHQLELVQVCLASGKRVIVVAMESPYDLSLYSGASTCICSLGASRAAMRNVVNIISGKLTPSGRLPITLQLEPPC